MLMTHIYIYIHTFPQKQDRASSTSFGLSFSDRCNYCERHRRYKVLTFPCSPSALCWCRRWRHRSSPSRTGPASDSEGDKKLHYKSLMSLSLRALMQTSGTGIRPSVKSRKSSQRQSEDLRRKSALVTGANTDQSSGGVGGGGGSTQVERLWSWSKWYSSPNLEEEIYFWRETDQGKDR